MRYLYPGTALWPFSTATPTSVRVLGLNSLGDSFLVERDDLRVLVDAGKGSNEVADRLDREGLDYLDVVVCTHCDADHIGGVPAVLSRLTVGELWVPGSWLSVLEQAAVATDDELLQFLGTRIDQWVLTESSEPVEDWADAVVKELAEQLSELEAQWHEPERFMSNLRSDEEPAVVGLQRLSDSDDRAMDRRLKQRLRALRKIYDTARRVGTKIRYFSYEEAEAAPDAYWLKSGEPGWMTIINAREIYPRTTPHAPVLLYFALTIQNRRAIVPFVQAADPFGVGTPTGMLMCSDSSFEFIPECPPPWSRIGIITAPHHGSANDAHDSLYLEAERHGFAGLWVRSHNDTKYPSWPGSHWRHLDVERRFCTRCRGDRKRPAQDLWFISDGTRWEIPDRLRPCRCADT